MSTSTSGGLPFNVVITTAAGAYMKKTTIQKTQFFDHDNMVNNEKGAKIWAEEIEKELTRVAAWTAFHVKAEKEEEWDSLHRVAFLHNNVLAEATSWAHALGKLNLHFSCAMFRLLPIGTKYVSGVEPRSGSWGESRPCDRCLHAILPQPSDILREATVSALTAEHLPEGDGEENPDPKMDYLVKHMLRMLFRSKRSPDKEVSF